MLVSVSSQNSSFFSEDQKHILEEMRDTEIKFKNYLDCILSAKEAVIHELKSTEINVALSEYDAVAIFVTLREIANLSVRTADILDKIFTSRNSTQVVKLLDEYMQFLPNYADAMYQGVVRYKLLVNALGEKANLLDEATRNALTDPKFESLSFSSFCIMPVQRFPRVILMLTDLCKNTSSTLAYYQPLAKTLSRFKDETDKINENIKELETVLLIDKAKELKIEELLKKTLSPDGNDALPIEMLSSFIRLVRLASKLVIHSKLGLDKSVIESNDQRATTLIKRKQHVLHQHAAEFGAKYQEWGGVLNKIEDISEKERVNGNGLPDSLTKLLQQAYQVYQKQYLPGLKAEQDPRDRVKYNLGIQLEFAIETRAMLAILGSHFSDCHRREQKKPAIFEYVDDIDMPVLQFNQKVTSIELIIFSKSYLDDLESIIFQLQNKLPFKENRAEIILESNDERRAVIRSFVRISGALISIGVHKIDSNWLNELKLHARQFPEDLNYNVFKEISKLKSKDSNLSLQKQMKFNLIQRLVNNRLIPLSSVDFDVDDNMLIVVNTQDPYLGLPQIAAAINAGFSFFCKKFDKLEKRIAKLQQPELLLSIKVPLSEAIASRLNQTLNKKYFIMMERKESQHLTDVASRRNLSVPNFLRDKKSTLEDEKKEAPEKLSPPRQHRSLTDLKKITADDNFNLGRPFFLKEKISTPDLVKPLPGLIAEKKTSMVLAMAQKFDKEGSLNPRSRSYTYTPMRSVKANDKSLNKNTNEVSGVKPITEKLDKLNIKK